MLSELLEVERALRAAGIGVQLGHKDVKPLAKRAVLRAFVNTDTGSVERVSVLKADEAQRFWRLGNNQNGFPLLSIGPRDDKRAGKRAQPIGLRSGADPGLIKASRSSQSRNERASALRSLFSATSLDVGPLLPWPTDRKWLNKQRQLLAAVARTEAASVLELLDSVLRDVNGRQLLASLDHALRTFTVSQSLDTDAIDVLTKVAFSGGGEVLLDTARPDAGARSAASPANADFVAEALRAASSNAPIARCLISGKSGPVITGPFPQARFPIIGNAALFDRNKDTPSATRYGQRGSDSCRVSSNLADRLAAAARQITAPERKGRTWSDLPTERPAPKRGKKPPNDLLLSFVAAPVAPNIAGAIIDPAVFETLAHDVVQLARGSDVDLSERVEFVVIRKLTRGNQKVLLRTTSSLAELAKAAELWTAGCRNLPSGLPHPRSVTAVQQPAARVVVPAALAAIGKRVFVRGGTDHYEAPGPTFADAMQLFLGTDALRHLVARKLLPMILARGEPLLVGWKHADRRGESAAFDANHAGDVLTVISLLLHAQQRTQGAYMEDAAFKLGQLLAGADILHRGYCEHQRKGDVPSAMLGNQMLAIAARNPTVALDLLLQRWRVYAGWADRYRSKIEKPADSPSPGKWAAYNGVWAPVNMRPLADSLHARLPQTVQPIFRAELLLGYIAGLPRRDTPNAAPTTGSEQAADTMLED